MRDGFVLDKPPESICMLRLSAIGDVCHMVAVVQSMQRHFPNVPITWVIGRIEADLVSDLPGIEFIIFDKKQGWRAYQNLYRSLRHRHFDVLLHAQVALRASLASLCIRANYRIGFDKARAKDFQWLFTKQRIRAVPSQHVLAGFQEFAACLGVPIAPPQWDIPISGEAQSQILELVPQQNPILVIHPAASADERNWSEPRYAAIAEYAIKKHGMTVVITGAHTQKELRMADLIQTDCCLPLINLVGKIKLQALLALLQRATAVIGPDTGPMHMATMVGTPVIGLYACSNPLRTGPYLSLGSTVNQYPAALQHYLQLSEQQAEWGKRVHGATVMDLITVESVRAKLDSLLLQCAHTKRQQEGCRDTAIVLS